ncbi:LysR family transcriptional regulator [Seohaeicola nanhaiensis]|uniref:LysR family transcriptional regulator n=1 Tax=Seohaeicola nanhaiensis TaxID=1387282 RepID=A0ABV9KD94_9RHOB
MQDPDWNDLRAFLGVVRAGSFVGAGQALGLHETTVARSITRLERQMGRALFLRPRLVLTPFGAALRDVLAGVEPAMAGAAALAARGAGASGPVRLAAVHWIVVEVLMPQVAALRARAPEVELTLLSAPDRTEPALGEADLALRFARPQEGTATLARRLATVPFVLCGTGEGWVGYGGGGAQLPQAAWSGQPVALRVDDLSGALAAVRAGLGRAHLPVCIAPVGVPSEAGDWSREFWLLRHPARRGDPAMEAVIGWLDQCVAPRLSGVRP